MRTSKTADQAKQGGTFAELAKSAVTIEELLGSAAPCLPPDVPESSLEIARNIETTSPGRRSIPLRWSFTHAAPPGEGDSTPKAPMARIIGAGGRGGGVPVKLYLALIWRAAGAPHTTNYSARLWAELLALPDPETKGARRVSDALRTLEQARLVSITRVPGEPSTVALLDESGSGAAYQLPSTAYYHAKTLAEKAKSAERKKKFEKEMDANLYSRLPLTLWTNGHIQAMSSAALAMLLILMSNSRASEGKEIWWSTQKFPERYGISPATRARGTSELQARGLLKVTKRLVANSPNNTRALTSKKVRSIYTLINDAKLSDSASQPDSST
ncbi:hypothetical protein [Nocardia cerradoensis]|uniref:Uncharacterized protein n=1 Tax=Nocardia cerradoensis TaxID=85688 RepID=A0A231GSY4_9NOCA|nr:hypothetical protein [Nocardia cerradoensis]NKY43559.1 hypothetical protein [Nocardia cerradoensis]OXR39733.1 hypothetical protein B7C42_08194 [Nocardia cerradoensis]